MLLALSDSREINFIFSAPKTLFAMGSIAQLPVVTFSAVKKNWFPVCNIKQS